MPGHDDVECVKVNAGWYNSGQHSRENAINNPGLIPAEYIAARFQHLFLQQRNAKDIDQQPVNERRAGQREPAPPPVPAGRQQRVGDPAESHEEVVGVARSTPPSRIAHAALIGGVFLEAARLLVGHGLTGYGDDGGQQDRNRESNDHG
jgi:hypothetical protein